MCSCLLSGFLVLLVGRFRSHQFVSVSPPDDLGRRQPRVRVESTGQQGVGPSEESEVLRGRRYDRPV